jgi:hypothetical protein
VVERARGRPHRCIPQSKRNRFQTDPPPNFLLISQSPMISYRPDLSAKGASYGEKNGQCKRNLGRHQSGNGLFRLGGEISVLGKSLQRLSKKLTDTGVAKNSELDEQRISLQRKTGDPANHKEYLEPMEALSAVS